MPNPVKTAIVYSAAASHGISGKTLYGVWGVETSFGANKNTSSAGAVGDFQFLPSTAKSLGVNPYNFASAANGAAKYLKQLGADGNPESEATKNALSKYNGGGGAGYYDKVIATGKNAKGAAPDKNSEVGAGFNAVKDAGSSVASAALDPIKAVASAATDTIDYFFGNDAGKHYIRIGKIVGGLALILIGLISLVGAGKSTLIKTAVEAVA